MHDTATRRRLGSRDVLVVVEDHVLRELIAAHLRHQGRVVLSVAGASEAVRLVAQVRPDLVVLDGDSASARDARLAEMLSADDAESRIPLIVLQSSASRAPSLLLPTLRIDKPCRPQALAEAVHRLLVADQPAARAPLPTAGVLRAGPLVLDFERRAATVAGMAGPRWVDLAPTEMRLLQHLMQSAGRTLTRAEIVDEVWGRGAEVDARTVDQYVRRLREALEQIGVDAVVRTVRGLGYRADLTALKATGDAE